MNRGKSICNTLKGIRQKVADENGIDYKPVECHHEGECLGTCPACEAEVRYLDQQLNAMRLAGKAVRIAGISLGITALTACHSSNKTQEIMPLEGEPPIRQDGPPTRPLMGKPSIPVDTLNLIATQEDGTKIFGMAEQQPSFQGGQQALMKFIEDNLQYPDGGVEEETRVVVSFTIEKDGTVANAKVIKNASEELGREALRLVGKMPKWMPGKQNGNAVTTKYTMPIVFKPTK